MVTVALSILQASNWPAEPVSLWVETQESDLWLVSGWVMSLYSICQPSKIPLFVCMHMYTYICTLCMSITCVSLIKACWLLSLSSLFQCPGLLPLHKIYLIHPLLSPGEISTRTTLDREQQSSYQLVVVVQDGGSPPRSASGTAFITVLDDNDNHPSFTHSQSGKSLIIQVMP